MGNNANSASVIWDHYIRAKALYEQRQALIEGGYAKPEEAPIANYNVDLFCSPLEGSKKGDAIGQYYVNLL